jgi:hypothetical protein
MMLRRMAGPKRHTGENFTMRYFMIFRLLFKLLRFIFYGGGGRGGERVTWYARERRELKVLVGKPCREEKI